MTQVSFRGGTAMNYLRAAAFGVIVVSAWICAAEVFGGKSQHGRARPCISDGGSKP